MNQEQITPEQARQINTEQAQLAERIGILSQRIDAEHHEHQYTRRQAAELRATVNLRHETVLKAIGRLERIVAGMRQTFLFQQASSLSPESPDPLAGFRVVQDPGFQAKRLEHQCGWWAWSPDDLAATVQLARAHLEEAHS